MNRNELDSSASLCCSNVSNLYDKGFVVRNDLLASQGVLAEAREHEIQA